MVVGWKYLHVGIVDRFGQRQPLCFGQTVSSFRVARSTSTATYLAIARIRYPARNRHRRDEMLLEARFDRRFNFLDLAHFGFDQRPRLPVEQRDSRAGTCGCCRPTRLARDRIPVSSRAPLRTSHRYGHQTRRPGVYDPHAPRRSAPSGAWLPHASRFCQLNRAHIVLRNADVLLTGMQYIRKRSSVLDDTVRPLCFHGFVSCRRD